MLVLVPGITGNLGLHLLDSLSSRGPHARGLGRSPDKLNDLQKSNLEAFIQMKNY